MAKTGKKVILKNKIDKATLGGVILRYGGVQLDGSVKTRLDKFEEALTETVI
jgi:F0F1-type ATP synthase delta subunit